MQYNTMRARCEHTNEKSRGVCALFFRFILSWPFLLLYNLVTTTRIRLLVS